MQVGSQQSGGNWCTERQLVRARACRLRDAALRDGWERRLVFRAPRLVGLVASGAWADAHMVVPMARRHVRLRSRARTRRAWFGHGVRAHAVVPKLTQGLLQTMRVPSLCTRAVRVG
jgi:hypothetical protein